MWPENVTREARKAYVDRLDTYFEGNWEPSEEGGFRGSAYGDGLTECKSCGALVMQGYMESSLNRHRAWHDKNDREGADD